MGRNTRKALIVGIDYYENESVSNLNGCVNDARAMKKTLERNNDGSKNFDVKFIEAANENTPISQKQLRTAIEELFQSAIETVLFYFAGHGYIESSGGYIMSSNACTGDEGISLKDLLNLANHSPATNKVIILDSCFSGMMGYRKPSSRVIRISEGVTIITSSDKNQSAKAENQQGIFTTLLVDALNGGAADLLGQVTPGSAYAYIDQSLGAWSQRPVFKSNVKNFLCLRTAKPSVELASLLTLPELFGEATSEFKLDPTFEPELKGRDKDMPAPNPKHVETFQLLQKFNRVNLVEPVNAPHMWHAAMQSKSCKLTVLGQHYWRLVKEGRI